jgi:hypothetical protein
VLDGEEIPMGSHRSRRSETAEPAPERHEPTPDEKVEQLARQLANEVRVALAENREALRDYAAGVLRAETEGAGVSAVARARRRRPVGPLALAFLLVLTGGVFTIVLPPVGVVLLVMAVMTFGWGVIRLAVHGGSHDTAPPGR